MQKITKDSNCITTYLSFLQNNISRMHTASYSIKAMLLTGISLIVGVCTNESIRPSFIVATIVAFILDSYFLGLEKIYRKKYNSILEALNNESIRYEDVYDMNPYVLNNGKTNFIKCMTKSVISFPQLLTYIGITIILIIGG